MKKQPASKSYFFDKGYRDVARVMKKTWANAFKPVSNEAERVKDIFSNNVIAGIFTVLCDIVVFSLITIFIITVNLVFSILFFCFFVFVGIFVYLGYSILSIVDFIFCMFKHISSHCPNCQMKFGLPTYKCPKCGALHTSLRPSKYGILKRKCNCGEKFPTTFFNGRQKLKAVCPYCGTNIKDGGQHIEITIPVVGGPNSGKTCYTSMAISQIEKTADKDYDLLFEYKENVALGDNYKRNKAIMSKGGRPDKTEDLRLRYYQFYLTPKSEKVRNLISICDVAGETYGLKDDEINKQIGFKHANAFLVLVDPLSIKAYREEVGKTINLKEYGASEKPMDEVLDALIHTLESMKCIDSKSAIKTDVAVVFTKCDIPGLSEKIGAEGVAKYKQKHNITSTYEAQNKVCEHFLMEYEENNFLNSLKSKFKSIQFFTCSALGHVVNGKRFNPVGVEEPALWLIDKASVSINLKKKWGKKI